MSMLRTAIAKELIDAERILREGAAHINQKAHTMTTERGIFELKSELLNEVIDNVVKALKEAKQEGLKTVVLDAVYKATKENNGDQAVQFAKAWRILEDGNQTD